MQIEWMLCIQRSMFTHCFSPFILFHSSTTTQIFKIPSTNNSVHELIEIYLSGSFNSESTTLLTMLSATKTKCKRKSNVKNEKIFSRTIVLCAETVYNWCRNDLALKRCRECNEITILSSVAVPPAHISNLKS